jgi:hypothetical protein
MEGILMLPIITLAQGILAATGLDDKIGDWIDGKTGGAASKVIEIAGSVMGGNPSASDMSPEQAAEIKRRLLDAESEIRQLAAADRREARAMYTADKGSREITNEVIRNIMRFNLPAIVLLIICNALVVQYVDNPTIALALGNTIGAAIAIMWQERRTVIEFLMGGAATPAPESKGEH